MFLPGAISKVNLNTSHYKMRHQNLIMLNGLELFRVSLRFNIAWLRVFISLSLKHLQSDFALHLLINDARWV